MANAIKKAARSRRSHRDDKNFRQFAWNAHRRAEERAKIQFGRMLAEEIAKGKEKKENE
jgi:basic membrane lipoprotein Med (substrate-binding protein (PBP1-ABC) superfamily)